MKFICEKNAFHKEIAFSQEIISSKSVNAVFSNVYLEVANNSLLIRATDIKIGFETRIPVEVIEEGSVTVFCDTLCGILSTIPEGTLEISQGNNKLVIKPSFKKAQFNIKTISSDQFPQLPDTEDENYFSVPAVDFKEMITQTIFAVSEDKTRSIMTGVYMERAEDGIVMIATDGKRLAYIKKEITEGIHDFGSIIIPPKILSIITKKAPSEGIIELAVKEKNLFVKFGQYKLSTVLIEGQYPNCEKVIPSSQAHKIIVRRQDLIDALKRISIFSEKSRRMIFTFSDNKMIISSEEVEIGTANEEIDCIYEDEEAVLCLNYKNLDEPLRIMKGEDVSIAYTDTFRAITLAPEPKDDYFHILMPMQID